MPVPLPIIKFSLSGIASSNDRVASAIAAVTTAVHFPPPYRYIHVQSTGLSIKIQAHAA
jgi:hypothetical protein